MGGRQPDTEDTTMSTIKTYTVWITESDGSGTAHVSSHRAKSPDGAVRQAIDETAADWGGWNKTDLRVLGIATGVVELIEWNDL
jgi:hypothetical protein